MNSNSSFLSGIQRLKQKMTQSGLHTNQDNQSFERINKTLAQQQRSSSQLSKERQTTGNKPHQQPKASKPTQNTQNLSRKQALQKEKPHDKKDKPSVKPKMSMNSMFVNPVSHSLNSLIQDQIKQRENFKQLETIPEDSSQLLKEPETSLTDQHNSVQDILLKFQQKLDSADRRIDMPALQVKNQAKVSPFDPNEKPDIKKSYHNADDIVDSEDHSGIKNSIKTLFESTAAMSSKESLGMYITPMGETSKFTLGLLGDSEECHISQFKASDSKMRTDENGNRLSIMPKEGRPERPQASKTKTQNKGKESKKKLRKNIEEQGGGEEEEKKTQLERIQDQVKVLKEQESKGIKKNTERQNFVKMNMNKSYKPRARGAVYTNKIMAKKRNNLRFRDNIKKKLQIERAKNRDQVNMYGGLGKVGLDHEGKINDEGEVDEAVPSFSSSALKFVSKFKKQQKEQEHDLLIDNLDQISEELQEIDEEILEDVKDLEDPLSKSQDAPLYDIPKDDATFLKILKERFGHESFLEGQLESIKLLLHKKQSTLIVLATGAGKSLVYQYVSLFIEGLMIVVTPLISLMTDQLQKIPSFITAACINSQQGFQQKKMVIQAVKDKAIKILFISPERFFMEDFSKFDRPVNLVCVDEIHCSSEWSHNFRPTYLKLHDMIKDKLGKDALILGLTATATRATQKSICTSFNIKYPEGIITQPDLSRLNLHLSITRDSDKQKALITLLKSENFRKFSSILIYATQKRTTEQLASYLNQEGISTQAYHAGKTDTQRQAIQKLFINNQVRVLVCTIAFSMGIDKSDIQSVIHYDMPRSIEGYVQEIGRAGRDGKLARCHLFLNNSDFYQIRRILLTDLLDSQNSLKLTSRVIVEAKRQFLGLINPEFKESKKRRYKKNTGNEKAILIEDFEHENVIQKYYETGENGQKHIDVENCEDLEGPLYVFLNTKEVTDLLDLKKEVVLTMLNSLEKLGNGRSFFKLESMLPASVGVRFHKSTPEELAETNPFIKAMLEIGSTYQGVLRCSIQLLAYKLNMNPFQIPKILYGLQNSDQQEISYELDQESFVLKMKYLPSSSQIKELSELMLQETRRIEDSMISKLNCMYFVARKVSVPTIDSLLKKEKQGDIDELYMGFTKKVNDLINMYFRIEDESKEQQILTILGDMEIQIAGNEEEREIMMPLLYIKDPSQKAAAKADIKGVLREFHEQNEREIIYDPSERIKPLEVTKILMGIYSDKPNIKRFMNESKFWAKYQEHDYKDVYNQCWETVNKFYTDNVCGKNEEESEICPKSSKMRRIEE